MEPTDTLTALSPLDGRYAAKLGALRDVFSEFGLIRRRVAVEVAWLEALCDAPDIPEARALAPDEREFLSGLADRFSVSDARRVKEIEAVTNHDVKAVEYFLKERLAGTSLAPHKWHGSSVMDGKRCFRRLYMLQPVYLALDP